MIIKKILNNNALIAIDSKREEVIVTGLGVAFQMKAGQLVDEAKVERIFTQLNQDVSKKVYQLFSKIPVEIINISESIITQAKKELNVVLNDNIFLTLTDHIHFAIERHNSGINIDNPMKWEVKQLYPKEYQVGVSALDLCKRELDIDFPNGEAASIAMHIVNAELNEQMPNVISMLKMIQEILNIIRLQFNITYDEDSHTYQRLVTHLKFFAQRIISNTHTVDEVDQLFSILKDQFPSSYECVKKINNFTKEKYEYTILENEMAYLIVHIERIISKMKSE